MKAKKPKWQRVLTKAEITHLKDTASITKKAFISNNAHQNNMRNEAGAHEPCYQCKTIALKLGLPVSPLRPEPVRQAVMLVDNNKPKYKLGRYLLSHLLYPVPSYSSCRSVVMTVAAKLGLT